MKHRNDPTRNLIQTWYWGPGRFEIYTDPKKAPRWIRNYGDRLGDVHGTCAVPWCKEIPKPSEWYVRHPFLGVVCVNCAQKEFGAVLPYSG